MALSPEQRTAQRVFVGLVRVGAFRLDKTTGWSIWRLNGSEEWQRDVPELSKALDALGVPYSVAVERRKVRNYAQPQMGFRLIIGWNDVDQLVAWVPSLRQYVDAVAGGAKSAGLG